MTSCLSHGQIETSADQGDMTILTYFTCMVMIVTLLIFNKVMQSMFLAFQVFISEVIPSCAATASKADTCIIIILWVFLQKIRGHFSRNKD